MVKTTIFIPDPVFQAAEELAQQLGVSRSELYARALLVYVESHHDDHVTALLDELYAKEDSTLDAVIWQLQAMSLPASPF